MILEYIPDIVPGKLKKMLHNLLIVQKNENSVQGLRYGCGGRAQAAEESVR